MGMQGMEFDYYYGEEAGQFPFYKMPRALVKDSRFKGLSSDAKILYGLMLDRLSLSMKNGWLDGEGRAYIYYRARDIMEDLGCAKATCTKVLAELDGKKGIGLIERKRQGLGKPDIIYVKSIGPGRAPQGGQEPGAQDPGSPEAQGLGSQGPAREGQGSLGSESPKAQGLGRQEPEGKGQEGLGNGKPGVHGLGFREPERQAAGGTGLGMPEGQDLPPSYINNSYTENSHTDLCIGSGVDGVDHINHINHTNHASHAAQPCQDACASIEAIRENIGYDCYMQQGSWRDREMFGELYGVICSTVRARRKTVRVGGADLPYGLVVGRLLSLRGAHLEYVIECMRRTASKIRNIRAYMLTALYNALDTMEHYYQQEAQHDLYGGGMPMLWGDAPGAGGGSGGGLAPAY